MRASDAILPFFRFSVLMRLSFVSHEIRLVIDNADLWICLLQELYIANTFNRMEHSLGVAATGQIMVDGHGDNTH